MPSNGKPATPGSSPTRQQLFLGGIAFLTMCALVTALVLTRAGSPERGESPDAPGPTSSAKTAEVTLKKSTTQNLNLPKRERTASIEFDGDRGEKRVVNTTVTATFTASTGLQRAVYVLVGLSCGPTDGGGDGESTTGTENLIHQRTRELEKSLVYLVPDSGTHRCNVTFDAPNWDSGYGDAEAILSTHVSVSDARPAGPIVARTDSRDPIVIDSGTNATVIEQTFPLNNDQPSSISFLTNSHLTTCTEQNGSSDGTGGNLCTNALIDTEGSRVIVRASAEILRDGEICRRMVIDESTTAIDHLVHHKMLGSDSRSYGFLDDACGDELRLSLNVLNYGPAGLVVHREPTRIIAY